jgi:hypothetical protein
VQASSVFKITGETVDGFCQHGAKLVLLRANKQIGQAGPVV